MLIEPIPQKYDELLTNRPNNICENYALVDFDYKKEFVELYYSNLMSVTKINDNIDVDIKSHVNSGNKFINDSDTNKNKILEIRSSTLQSLLDKHNITHINFFSLDVEGNELNVLNGIDFNKTTFDYILIESRNINCINNFLLEKGYKNMFKLSHHDYLFINNILKKNIK